MPIAIIFVLIIAAGVAVYGTSALISSPQPAAQLHNAQATWFSEYVGAANAFAQQNHGFSGAISDAQIQPFMGPYAGLLGTSGSFARAGVQYGAAIVNGNLTVWASPSQSSGTTYLTGLKQALQGDLSAIFIKQGSTLVSPTDGQTIAAPF